MRTLLNLLWFVLAGIWSAIGYALAGVVCVLLIVTIPLAVPAFRMAGYVIWPFGRTVVNARERQPVATVANVVWVLLFGWWLALGHLISGLLLCVTIVGIPFGIASFKLAVLAFAPYGKAIVPLDSVPRVERVATVGG